MSLTKKILIALVLGVVVGLGLNFVPADVFEALDTYALTPVGQLFLNLIMMLVVPIVFISIVLGVAGLNDPVQLGRIGVKTIGFYLATTAIALVIGLSLAYIVQLVRKVCWSRPAGKKNSNKKKHRRLWIRFWKLFQIIQLKLWQPEKCFKLLLLPSLLGLPLRNWIKNRRNCQTV